MNKVWPAFLIFLLGLLFFAFFVALHLAQQACDAKGGMFVRSVWGIKCIKAEVVK